MPASAQRVCCAYEGSVSTGRVASGRSVLQVEPSGGRQVQLPVGGCVRVTPSVLVRESEASTRRAAYREESS